MSDENNKNKQNIEQEKENKKSCWKDIFFKASPKTKNSILRKNLIIILFCIFCLTIIVNISISNSKIRIQNIPNIYQEILKLSDIQKNDMFLLFDKRTGANTKNYSKSLENFVESQCISKNTNWPFVYKISKNDFLICDKENPELKGSCFHYKKKENIVQKIYNYTISNSSIVSKLNEDITLIWDRNNKSLYEYSKKDDSLKEKHNLLNECFNETTYFFNCFDGKTIFTLNKDNNYCWINYKDNKLLKYSEINKTHFSVIANNDNVYLIGGTYDLNGVYYRIDNEIIECNKDSKDCILKGHLNKNRSDSNVLLIDDKKLLIIGGEETHNVFTNSVPKKLNFEIYYTNDNIAKKFKTKLPYKHDFIIFENENKYFLFFEEHNNKKQMYYIQTINI